MAKGRAVRRSTRKIEMIIHHREFYGVFSGADWYRKTCHILRVRTETVLYQEGNARYMYAPVADGAWKMLHDIHPQYTAQWPQPTKPI